MPCLRALSVVSALLLLAGCAVLSPPPAPQTLEERLSVFPKVVEGLERDVSIRWNAYQVPYIKAAGDEDAAFALGMVHAHLRLGQLEVIKRISQGRISEMAGPFVRDIDTALRILDFGKAVPEILAAMPAQSRAWLDHYVSGINTYRATLTDETRPHEYTIFNMDPSEPWTAEDSLTLGRLFGTDVNWLVWFALLGAADDPGFADIYQDAIDLGLMSVPTIPAGSGVGEGLARLSGILDGMAKTGSNSVVVSAQKSATGTGMIANDPHLGFLMPNAWLVAGLKSPSYHVVGMMPPGVPVFGFGRTADIAWGGTNLRSLNSDLVDLRDVPESALTTRVETLGVRAWPDRDITIRQSPYGPVISDADVVPGPQGRDFAVRWAGHGVSDEITAMLDVAKARNWEEFTRAVKPFSLPAQNFLFVDRKGEIGHIVATHMPKRPPEHRDTILVPPAVSDAGWADMLDSDRLPRIANPPSGYLHSSNNKPAQTDYPIGYFFPPDERQRRIAELMDARDKISLQDLKALQRDVVSPNSRAIARRLGETPTEGWDADEKAALSSLAVWDGAYNAGSRDAVVFQAFLEAFWPPFSDYLDRETTYGIVKDRPQLLLLMQGDLAHTELADISAMVRQALADAKDQAGNKVWGDIHRLKLSFLLGNVPIVGGAYEVGDYPVGGTQETVMKTAHSLTVEEHRTRYGAQSRHISDMGDPDANYFVLVGGNDGWINSANSNDQTPLWLEGEYVRVPLTGEAIRQDFPVITQIRPAP